MKTYTPELDPGVGERLRDYAHPFADDFPRSKPARWAGVYLQGLLLDGERKRIEPLSRRVTLPGDLASQVPERALPPFVDRSPRDERTVLRRYRGRMAQTFAGPDGIFLVARAVGVAGFTVPILDCVGLPRGRTRLRMRLGSPGHSIRPKRTFRYGFETNKALFRGPW